MDANTELKTKLAMQQPATVQTQRLEVEEQVEPKCGIAGSIPSIFVSCRKTIVINANYARCVQVPSEK